MARRLCAIRRGLLRFAGVIAFMALLALGTLVWKIDQFGRVDQAQRADAIIILGAQVQVNGQPGPDLMSRTQHGVALYKEGLAPNVITTGGFVNEPLSAAAVARRTAIAGGVPATRVYMAEGSQSTQEDAAVATQVMRAHGWQSAILVSHPLHLYRAQLLFEQAGLQVFPSPTNTHVDDIDGSWRLFYAGREAASLLWMTVRDWAPVRPWAAWVNKWFHREYVALVMVHGID